MRWSLQHYVRCGWYEINRYDTEGAASMEAARWAWMGMRLRVVRVGG